MKTLFASIFALSMITAPLGITAEAKPKHHSKQAPANKNGDDSAKSTAFGGSAKSGDSTSTAVGTGIGYGGNAKSVQSGYIASGPTSVWIVNSNK